MPAKLSKKATSSKPRKRGEPVAKLRRGYAGRSADELAGERRQRLLDTALELFCTRGYHKTPIELLCTEARVTTRHFYEQFPTREALLVAVYEKIIAHARSTVLRALQTPGLAPENRISEAIRAFVHSYTDDPRHARIACIEVVGVSADMAQRRRKVIHEFSQLVEAYANLLAGSGLLPKRDYHLNCVGLVGAVNELMSEWLTVDNPPSVALLTEELLAMFRAIILGTQTLMKSGEI